MADSAQLRSAQPDCEGARMRLDAAERFSKSAGVTGLHREAAYVLYYHAARNALSAVLTALGKRVGDGRGAYAVTIREAGRALGRPSGGRSSRWKRRGSRGTGPRTKRSPLPGPSSTRSGGQRQRSSPPHMRS